MGKRRTLIVDKRQLQSDCPAPRLARTENFLVGSDPIHGVVQEVIPISIQQSLLYHLHYPTLAGQPGERGMYEIIGNRFYWPHIANKVYTIVKDCCKCARSKPSHRRRRPIQLFLASGPLKSGAVDILGPLLRTLHGD